MTATDDQPVVTPAPPATEPPESTRIACRQCGAPAMADGFCSDDCVTDHDANVTDALFETFQGPCRRCDRPGCMARTATIGHRMFQMVWTGDAPAPAGLLAAGTLRAEAIAACRAATVDWRNEALTWRALVRACRGDDDGTFAGLENLIGELRTDVASYAARVVELERTHAAAAAVAATAQAKPVLAAEVRLPARYEAAGHEWRAHRATAYGPPNGVRITWRAIGLPSLPWVHVADARWTGTQIVTVVAITGPSPDLDPTPDAALLDDAIAGLTRAARREWCL